MLGLYGSFILLEPLHISCGNARWVHMAYLLETLPAWNTKVSHTDMILL